MAALCATHLHAAGPVVLLIGPPAVGKSTQAEILRKDLGMAVISADDLIAHHQQAFQRFRNPAIDGVDPHLDPALNSLVEEALRTADISKGVVLAGYPAAKHQGDFLVGLKEKFNLPKAVVVHLRAPDDVISKRLKKENAQNIEQQLKDYHRELDFVRAFFPQSDIHDVDGTKKPQKVASEIRKLLSH